MKPTLKLVVCIVSLAAALAARAEETLPALKVGSRVYTNVTVTSVTTSNVFFNYAGGMGSAKIRNLDPELQQHFAADIAKAREAEAEEKAKAAAELGVSRHGSIDLKLAFRIALIGAAVAGLVGLFQLARRRMGGVKPASNRLLVISDRPKKGTKSTKSAKSARGARDGKGADKRFEQRFDWEG